MKRCSECKAILPLRQFHFKNRARGRRQAKCKDCSKMYSRIHYAKNAAQYSNYRRANTAVSRTK